MANGPDISLAAFAGTREALLDIVETFCRDLFPDLPKSYVASRLEHIASPDLLLAKIEGRPVGFKLGYRLSDKLYFSWLGGVDMHHRRLGIASKLSHLQHACARDFGLDWVETRTRADNNAMLIVNLRSGFQIAGVEADSLGRFVVIQRKKLVTQSQPADVGQDF